jgi:hypothetical protein
VLRCARSVKVRICSSSDQKHDSDQLLRDHTATCRIHFRHDANQAGQVVTRCACSRNSRVYPDYALRFAWNHAAEIHEKEQAFITGDEVITVSHTAVATVAAIIAGGATPVLVDVDAASNTIDPARVDEAVGPRTKTIVAVHLYGLPADLDAVEAITKRHYPVPLHLQKGYAERVRIPERGLVVTETFDSSRSRYIPSLAMQRLRG